MELSVTQLNNYIKSVFVAEEMLHNVLLTGEVSGVSVRGNGVWFTLCDKDASIPCVCWDKGRCSVKNGDQVTLRGSVDYWQKAGKINFNVHALVKSGAGELLEQLKALTEKLKSEGLFDKKKTLPAKVKRIGVVSSRYGAVIHDIMTVTKRRNPVVDIVLYPASVQGENASREICAGVSYFNRVKNVDLIIVARGGGSNEDLSCFNTESVARSVAGSELPIVAAVGHETDFTLVDYVADLRAPTPSAAAEMVVPELVSQKEIVLRLWKQMKFAVTSRLEQIRTQTLGFMNLFPKDFVAVSKDGQVVKSVKTLKPKDKLQICFSDGRIGVTVDE
ncbi:MAG: exodeoxyribonuclease VII large subunit [Clostridia bacterium]|nr:exodeoxyribonuclease VII large subunit [Clostridia bacterium]